MFRKKRRLWNFAVLHSMSALKPGVQDTGINRRNIYELGAGAIVTQPPKNASIEPDYLIRSWQQQPESQYIVNQKLPYEGQADTDPAYVFHRDRNGPIFRVLGSDQPPYGVPRMPPPVPNHPGINKGPEITLEVIG
jgi:hypothetical protein